MPLKYADKLAWAQEQFERQLMFLSVNTDNLVVFAEERNPHQDDEDDCLEAVTEILRFANEQIEHARNTLEEGV